LWPQSKGRRDQTAENALERLEATTLDVIVEPLATDAQHRYLDKSVRPVYRKLVKAIETEESQ